MEQVGRLHRREARERMGCREARAHPAYRVGLRRVGVRERVEQVGRRLRPGQMEYHPLQEAQGRRELMPCQVAPGHLRLRAAQGQVGWLMVAQERVGRAGRREYLLRQEARGHQGLMDK